MYFYKIKIHKGDSSTTYVIHEDYCQGIIDAVNNNHLGLVKETDYEFIDNQNYKDIFDTYNVYPINKDFEEDFPYATDLYDDSYPLGQYEIEIKITHVD